MNQNPLGSQFNLAYFPCPWCREALPNGSVACFRCGQRPASAPVNRTVDTKTVWAVFGVVGLLIILWACFSIYGVASLPSGR